MTDPSGLLVLDKPSGFTSFDCVHRVRRILGAKRVGHCGTLDPMAQGVLLMLIGQATKEQESFLGLEKQYWFRAQFGWVSETGDREGKTIQPVPFSGVDCSRLESVLSSFLGEHSQTPPRYAALKYQGQPYYKWARRGIEIPRAPRTVRITQFELLRLDGALWEARVVCSRGTYIRSLVEDVGERLGTGALTEALIRERIGSYLREDALDWSRLSQCSRDDLLSYCDASIGHHSRHV